MKFSIKRHQSVHTGGTKYYQINVLTEEVSGRSVTIFSWGKVRGLGWQKINKAEAFRKVVNFNVRSFAEQSAQDQITFKKKPKDGGSYAEWTRADYKNMSAEEFTKKLEMISEQPMGLEDAIRHLLVGSGSSSTPITSTSTTMPPPSNTTTPPALAGAAPLRITPAIPPAPVVEEQPEGWGEW